MITKFCNKPHLFSLLIMTNETLRINCYDNANKTFYYSTKIRQNPYGARFCSFFARFFWCLPYSYKILKNININHKGFFCYPLVFSYGEMEVFWISWAENEQISFFFLIKKNVFKKRSNFLRLSAYEKNEKKNIKNTWSVSLLIFALTDH